MTQTSREKKGTAAVEASSGAGGNRNGVGAGLGNAKSSGEDENGSERSSGSMTDSTLSFATASSQGSWPLSNGPGGMTTEASNLLMKKLLEQLCANKLPQQQMQLDSNGFATAMASSGAFPMQQHQIPQFPVSQQQAMNGVQFLQQQLLQQQMLQQQGQSQPIGLPFQQQQTSQKQEPPPQSMYGSNCQYVVMPMQQNQQQQVMPQQQQQHQIMLIDPTQNIMRPLTQQEMMMLSGQQQQNLRFPYMATTQQQLQQQQQPYSNGRFVMPSANVTYMQAPASNVVPGPGMSVEMTGGNAQSHIRSKYRGVSWRKRDRKWLARTGFNGKTEHLGCFQSEEMAALAVDLRRIEHYGFDQRDRLNFSDDNEREALIKHFKKTGEFKIKTGRYNHLQKLSTKRRHSDDSSYSSPESCDDEVEKTSDEKPPPRKRQQSHPEKKNSETGSSSDADGDRSSTGPSLTSS